MIDFLGKLPYTHAGALFIHGPPPSQGTREVGAEPRTTSCEPKDSGRIFGSRYGRA
jgi:hypothetical protein